MPNDKKESESVKGMKEALKKKKLKAFFVDFPKTLLKGGSPLSPKK